MHGLFHLAAADLRRPGGGVPSEEHALSHHRTAEGYLERVVSEAKGHEG